MTATRTKRQPNPGGFGWLELLLLLTVIALLFQLFPATMWWLVQLLDIREWSRRTWFIANLIFVLVFVGIRTMPEIKAGLTHRHQKAMKLLHKERKRQAALDREARFSRRIL